MSAHVSGAFALAAGFATAFSLTAVAETAADRCGKAAWFAEGGLTASGERNGPGALTAAHRTLPFGTEVHVDNLDNGRSVVVRVNDRGPFTRGRIISVSRAAAERLGMTGRGVAKVRLTVGGDDQSPSGDCGVALKPPPANESAAETVEAASEDGNADRFAVAFEPESWREAELRKLIEASLPRFVPSLPRSEPRQPAPVVAEAPPKDEARLTAAAEIPWPALDDLTQVSVPAAVISYLWSPEVAFPDLAHFERIDVVVAVSQLGD